VATNILEWFIFNASDFEKLFASDKNLLKQFTDFEEGRLPATNTDFFYKDIAEPFIEKIESPISITYFNIRDFETIIKNTDRQDDNKLIALYKIFSPEHLLKLPFANDSNTLDKTFYNELLHIIGLEETKEGSKKIIGRKKPEKRNQASLIENAMTILRYEDCLSQLPKRSDFGKDNEEQLFNIALELVITWINRILFLKLLEGQLVRYNNGDKAFRFLNTGRVHDYDELNKLFFQVLAVKENDRNEEINEKFGNIPYLNSSLFEPSDLEHKTIRISNLDGHFKLPVLNSTVLKDKTGKKLTGEIETLHYLFEFLDSYDFSSEGSEDIQEENKTLINASVLGLIFEKINGYKDGSFFTPGFITMYMCHETIRRAIVQKFNETKGWKCETISDVYNKIEDIKEADTIINSLRICDPAVGSGHFLVSALNEIIAIKSELRILSDKKGERLKEYTVEVINDELIITDEQSNLFEYNPRSKESQRVQEALFLEKQKIIESCLFGVDINPNSVKICRLRLWIELLKNAYYKHGTQNAELETLPNIDINIKCGNSLISRYQLDADIKTALKSSRWNVDNYREAVMNYRNAQSKDEKRSMEQLIGKIKNDFETEVSKSDKRYLKLNKLNGELLSLTNQSTLFELSKTKKEEWNRKVKKLTEEIKKYETELEEVKSNKIYKDAFEWRFEFPEVLNNDGDFVGFDVVIGNPPYKRVTSKNEYTYFKNGYIISSNRIDLYGLFYERAFSILNDHGHLSFITPNTFLTNLQYLKLRKLIADRTIFQILDYRFQVFEDANVDTISILANNDKIDTISHIYKLENYRDFNYRLIPEYSVEQSYYSLNIDAFNIDTGPNKRALIQKIKSETYRLDQLAKIRNGINPGYPESRSHLLIQNPEIAKNPKKRLDGKDIFKYGYKWNDKWIDYDKSYFVKGGSLREESLFNEPKILVQDIRNLSLTTRLVACFDDENLYNLYTLHNIQSLNENAPNKYLLALLNSKLFNFYFANSFKDIHIKPRYLSALPMKLSSSHLIIKLVNRVDQIIITKKSDPAADTSALEADIDRLVYELYGLTEEEIRIVEGS
jgi:hypothetical protein